MNTEHSFFHLFETLSYLQNSRTKPASGDVRPELETKLPKPDYWLLTRAAMHYGRHGPSELQLDRRMADRYPRIRLMTQSGAASFESLVWIIGCLLAVLGLIHAAASEQPLLWLAVWPAPVALACRFSPSFVKGSISKMESWCSADRATEAAGRRGLPAQLTAAASQTQPILLRRYQATR
jgi:hypothetical protein